MAKQLPSHSAYEHFAELAWTSKQRPPDADPKARFFSCAVVGGDGKVCGALIRFFSVSNLVKHLTSSHASISLEQPAASSGSKRTIDIASLLLRQSTSAASAAVTVDDLSNSAGDDTSSVSGIVEGGFASPPAAKRAARLARSGAAASSASAVSSSILMQTKLCSSVAARACSSR
jgi:hypothetical protein